MSKKIQPGEWQTEVNPVGGTRRFRMVGNTKEYETEVITTHGTFTQSQIDQGLQGLPKAKTVPLESEKEKKYCPFNKPRRILCRESCAFWSKEGCMESDDTKGRKCPICIYTCDESCKLFNEGCSLIRKVR